MSASADYGLFQLPKNGPKRRGADVVGRVGAIKTGLAELEPSLLNPHHFIPIYPSTNLLAWLANRAAAGGQRKVKPQKQVDRPGSGLSSGGCLWADRLAVYEKSEGGEAGNVYVVFHISRWLVGSFLMSAFSRSPQLHNKVHGASNSFNSGRGGSHMPP